VFGLDFSPGWIRLTGEQGGVVVLLDALMTALAGVRSRLTLRFWTFSVGGATTNVPETKATETLVRIPSLG